MGYHPKIKQRALALIQEGYVAEKVANILSKELKDEPKSPCARTINRWKEKAKQSPEPERKPSRQIVVRDDGIYEKLLDIPNWAKNLKLVKTEDRSE